MSLKSQDGKSLKGNKPFSSGLVEFDMRSLVEALSHSGYSLNDVTLQNAYIWSGQMDDVIIGSLSPSSATFIRVQVGLPGQGGDVTIWGDKPPTYTYDNDGNITSIEGGDVVRWNPKNAIFTIQGGLSVRDATRLGNIVIRDNTIVAVAPTDGNIELIPESSKAYVYVKGNLAQTASGVIEFNKATDFSLESDSNVVLTARDDAMLTAERGDITIATSARSTTIVQAILHRETIVREDVTNNPNGTVTRLKTEQTIVGNESMSTTETTTINLLVHLVRVVTETRTIINGHPGTIKVTTVTVYDPEQETSESDTITETILHDANPPPFARLSNGTTISRAAVVRTITRHGRRINDLITMTDTNSVPSLDGDHVVSRVISPTEFEIGMTTAFSDATQGTIDVPKTGSIYISSSDMVRFDVGTPLVFGNDDIPRGASILASSPDTLELSAYHLQVRDPVATLNFQNVVESDVGIALNRLDDGIEYTAFLGLDISTGHLVWIPRSTIVSHEDGSKTASGNPGIMELKGIKVQEIIGNPDIEFKTPPNGSIQFESFNSLKVSPGISIGDAGSISQVGSNMVVETFYDLNLVPNGQINIPAGITVSFADGSNITGLADGGLAIVAMDVIHLDSNVTIPSEKHVHIGSGSFYSTDSEFTLSAEILNLSPTQFIRIPDDVLLQIGDTLDTGLIANDGNLLLKSAAGLHVRSGGQTLHTSVGDMTLDPDSNILYINSTQVVMPNESELLFSNDHYISTLQGEALKIRSRYALILDSSTHVDVIGSSINLHAADSIHIPNDVPLKFGVDSSMYSSSEGGFYINDPTGVFIDRNLTVTGTLTVYGPATEIVTTQITIKDPVITLGVTAATEHVKDRGIQFQYGDHKMGFMGFSQQDARFYLVKEGQNVDEVFTKDVLGDLAVNAIHAATATLTSKLVSSVIEGDPDVRIDSRHLILDASETIRIPFHVPMTFYNEATNLSHSIVGIEDRLKVDSPLVDVVQGKVSINRTRFYSDDNGDFYIQGSDRIMLESTSVNVSKSISFGDVDDPGASISIDGTSHLNLTSHGEIRLMTKTIFTDEGYQIASASLFQDQVTDRLTLKNVDAESLEFSIQGTIYDAQWRGQTISLANGGTGQTRDWHAKSVVFVDEEANALTEDPTGFVYDSDSQSLALRTTTVADVLTIGNGNIDFLSDDSNIYFRSNGSRFWRLGQNGSMFSLLSDTVNATDGTFRSIVTVNAHGQLFLGTATESAFESLTGLESGRIFVGEGNVDFLFPQTALQWNPCTFIKSDEDYNLFISSCSDLSIDTADDMRLHSHGTLQLQGEQLSITATKTYSISAHNVAVSSQDRLDLSAGGNTTITSQVNMELHANNKLTLEGSDAVELSTNNVLSARSHDLLSLESQMGDIKIDAHRDLTIRGGESCTLQGGKSLSLMGTESMDLSTSVGNIEIDSAQNIRIRAEHDISTVSRVVTIESATSTKISAGSNVIDIDGGSNGILVASREGGGDVTLVSAHGMQMNSITMAISAAQDINMTATDSLSFETASQDITLNSAKDIHITGEGDISLNASTNVNVDADNNVYMTAGGYFHVHSNGFTVENLSDLVLNTTNAMRLGAGSMHVTSTSYDHVTASSATFAAMDIVLISGNQVTVGSEHAISMSSGDMYVVSKELLSAVSEQDIVLKAFRDCTVISGRNTTIDCGETLSVSVSGSMTTTVHQNLNIQVGNEFNFNVTQRAALNAGEISLVSDSLLSLHGESVSLKAHQTFELRGLASLLLKSDGYITVDADAGINLHSKNAVNVVAVSLDMTATMINLIATGSYHLTSSLDSTVSSAQSLSITSGAGIAIESSGTTNMTVGTHWLVRTAQRAEFEFAGNWNVDVGGRSNLVVGEAFELRVATGASIVVGQNLSQSVGGAYAVAISDEFSVDVGESLRLKALVAQLEATEHVDIVSESTLSLLAKERLSIASSNDNVHVSADKTVYVDAHTVAIQALDSFNLASHSVHATSSDDMRLTSNKRLFLSASTEIRAESPLHLVEYMTIMEPTTRIAAETGGILSISSDHELRLQSEHVVIGDRLCLYHEPESNLCRIYQQRSVDNDLEIVNRIGDILLNPMSRVRLPESAKMTFGDLGSLFIQNGEFTIGTLSGDLRLKPTTNIISLSPAASMNFGGLTKIVQSEEKFSVESPMPVWLDAPIVNVPDNSKLTFGDMSRRIESDGDTLFIYSTDLLSLESNTVRVSGNLIVSRRSTFTVESETVFDSGVITLGGGNRRDIIDIQPYETQFTVVELSEPHGLRMGDSVILLDTVPNIDGTYVIWQLPTDHSFVISTAYPGNPSGEPVQGMARYAFTVNTGFDLGIQFNWHAGIPEDTSGSKTGFFGFDRSSKRFTFIPEALQSNNVYHGDPGDFEMRNLYAHGISATTLLSPLNAGLHLVQGYNFVIRGGSIDSTPIGLNVPSIGHFTNLTVEDSLTVTSTTLIKNLNADMLGGHHADAFLLRDGSSTLTNNWDTGGFRITATGLSDMTLIENSVVVAGSLGSLATDASFRFEQAVLHVPAISGFTLRGDVALEGHAVSNGRVEQCEILNTVFTHGNIRDSTATNIDVSGSIFSNGIVRDSELNQLTIADSQMQSSVVLDSNLKQVHIQDSDAVHINIALSNISNSTMDQSTVDASAITNGMIHTTNFRDGTLHDSELYNNTIRNSILNDNQIVGGTASDLNASNIHLSQSVLTDVSLDRATLTDGQINSSNIRDSILTNSDFSDGIITNSKLSDLEISDSICRDVTVTRSTFTEGIINNSSMSHVNASNGTFTDSLLESSSVSKSVVSDSMVKDSTVRDSLMTQTTIEESSFRDGYLMNSALESVVISHSTATHFQVSEGVMNGGSMDDYAIRSSQFESGIINESSFDRGALTSSMINNSEFVSGSLKDSTGVNVSFTGSTFTEGELENVHIQNGKIERSQYENGTIIDSALTHSIFADGVVLDSVGKRLLVSDSHLKDSAIVTSEMTQGTINHSEFTDGNMVNSSFSGGTVNQSTISESSIGTSNVVHSVVTSSELSGNTHHNSTIETTTFNEGIINQSEINNAKVKVSLIDKSDVSSSFITESTIQASKFKEGHVQNSNVTLEKDKLLDVSRGNVVFADGQISGNWVQGGISDIDIAGNANTVTDGVYRSEFDDHHTVLKADTAGSPKSLHVPEESLIGRRTNGVIDAIPISTVLEMFDVVQRSLFAANSILKADDADSPKALQIPEQTMVGRLPGGKISALTTEDVMQMILSPAILHRFGGMLRDGHRTVANGAKMTGLIYYSTERFSLTTGQVKSLDLNVETSYVSLNYSHAGGRLGKLNLGKGFADGHRKVIIASHVADHAVLQLFCDFVAPDTVDPHVFVFNAGGQSAHLQWDSVLARWLIVGSGCNVLTKEDLHNPNWIENLGLD
jgi:uncharacterized protein YjbI with pentapeptide repeats/uncharacterized protein (DUF2345 family)